MDHRILYLEGKFIGRGLNHSAEPFTGTMTLAPVWGNSGTALSFTAIGDDGQIYHDERTVLGVDPGHQIHMASASNNTGALLLYVAETIEDDRLVFRFGDLGDRGTFRETREVHVHDNGDVTYRFSWGPPGEPVRERSVLRMTPDHV